jgi:hypothetical protein
MGEQRARTGLGPIGKGFLFFADFFLEPFKK